MPDTAHWPCCAQQGRHDQACAGHGRPMLDMTGPCRTSLHGMMAAVDSVKYRAAGRRLQGSCVQCGLAAMWKAAGTATQRERRRRRVNHRACDSRLPAGVRVTRTLRRVLVQPTEALSEPIQSDLRARPLDSRDAHRCWRPGQLSVLRPESRAEAVCSVRLVRRTSSDHCKSTKLTGRRLSGLRFWRPLVRFCLLSFGVPRTHGAATPKPARCGRARVALVPALCPSGATVQRNRPNIGESRCSLTPTSLLPGQ